jgi:hypothetical protein
VLASPIAERLTLRHDDSLPGWTWDLTRDGDARARALYERHYSAYRYADGRKRHLFVGPGEKMVLLTQDGPALWVWRRFRSLDHQDGVNCAVFRNEGPWRSSQLILSAMDLAWRRWPGQRLYTYVNASRVRSPNPGYCFKIAGWRECGRTKDHGHRVLEVFPRG